MTALSDLAPTTDRGGGIVQMRLPMAGNPLRYINSYVVADDDGLTVIDSGWKADDVLAAFEDGLLVHGYALADVRRIVVTHVHFDHYGLAGTLRARGVPELLVHPRDWELAQEFGDPDRVDRESDAWLARNGYIVVPDAEPKAFHDRMDVAPPTRLIADGERIGRLLVWTTPGHSPGHCCFYDVRTGRMLTGDHILTPITPHVGRWRPVERDALGEYRDSLRKIGRVEATGALPAHGEPFPDLPGRVREIEAHVAARGDEVLAVLADAALTGGEVAERLRWTRRGRSFAEIGPDQQQFAVSETLAFLYHLERTGRLAAEDDGALIRYRRIPGGGEHG